MNEKRVIHFSLFTFHLIPCCPVILYPFPGPFPYSKGKGVFQYLLKTLNEKRKTLFTFHYTFFTFHLSALPSAFRLPPYYPTLSPALSLILRAREFVPLNYIRQTLNDERKTRYSLFTIHSSLLINLPLRPFFLIL
jgi:hypothetical protein